MTQGFPEKYPDGTPKGIIDARNMRHSPFRQVTVPVRPGETRISHW